MLIHSFPLLHGGHVVILSRNGLSVAATGETRDEASRRAWTLLDRALGAEWSVS